MDDLLLLRLVISSPLVGYLVRSSLDEVACHIAGS